MNTADKILLRTAEARWTRANDANDGTPARVAAYHDAKTALSVLRKSLRTGHQIHTRDGDAVAYTESLHLSASIEQE